MKQKGFAPVLILIALVIITAVGGGAYYFGKSQTPRWQPQPQNSVADSQILQPTLTESSSQADKTANWKIITNKDLTFRIPANWHYFRCTNKESEGAIFVGSKQTQDDSRACNFDGFPNQVFIGVGTNFTYKFLEDALPKAEKISILDSDGVAKTAENVISKIAYLTVGGEKAISWNSNIPFGPGEGKYYEVYIHSKNVRVSLNDLSLKPILDQILSTFKFLSPDKNSKAPTSADFNGFPIFSGLKFVKKKVTSPCAGVESGFSLCGSVTYTWTSDEADKVYNWYIKDQSGSGWKPAGGAGDYTNDQNFSSKTAFKKGDLEYDINWTAINNKLEFILVIPNK